jgi:succinyl-diaminopimelate desuccinylase
MTTKLDDVFALIDARFPEALALTQALVRIPSDNPPGDCAAHAVATRGLLEGLGFQVIEDVVPADLARAHGMISATNLIVRHSFGAGTGPVIALNAHCDVVPPGAGWTSDPYGGEIRDGWLYGRGAAVSKCDVATYAFALRALIDSGLPLNGGIELHITYDEEIGGDIGPGRIVKQGLTRATHAVCAAFSYAVVTAHNGCLHLEVTLHGKSAHAAWSDTGHDSLQAMTGLMGALYAYRAQLAKVRSTYPGLTSPSLVIGLISGGINTNVVPDKVTIRLDRRILPDESPEQAEADLRALIAGEVSGMPGIRADVTRILLAKPFVPVAGAAELAKVFSKHASVIMGEPVSTVALPLYTDARHYAEAGIPTIMYGAGPKNPLDANGHRADERVPVETIRKATKVIAAACADLLAR